jgi:hypothetical protein
MTNKTWDCLVIEAEPAGFTTALGLGPQASTAHFPGVELGSPAERAFSIYAYRFGLGSQTSFDPAQFRDAARSDFSHYQGPKTSTLEVRLLLIRNDGDNQLPNDRGRLFEAVGGGGLS